MFIYLRYKNTLYKIGKGKCWSFNTGKTKKDRLVKIGRTPSRPIKDVEIISAEIWDEVLYEFGY